MTRSAELDELRADLTAIADPRRAEKMAAYMKHQFEFLGVPTPARRAASRRFVRGGVSLTAQGLLDRATWCWNQREREFQYVGADLLARHVARLGGTDLDTVGALITSKSWWDTVDTLAAHVVGGLVSAYPETVALMDRWVDDANIWLARSAILHQLHYREATDVDRLLTYALRRGGDREFFIRKAIGWSLRQYAWTDPAVIARFVDDHAEQLSPLTRREAVKNVSS